MSDEDFSLVIPSLVGNSLAEIEDAINSYKKQHEHLLEEQKELSTLRDTQREFTAQFKERLDRMKERMKEDELSYEQQLDQETVKLEALKEEELSLMKEIQHVEAALMVEDEHSLSLAEQNAVFSAVPERKLSFTGSTGNPKDSQPFEMKSHVCYPMDGGTALVRFEEEVVAKKILDLKQHQVELSADVSIVVEAQPVHLVLPSLVEIDTKVCPRRILISDLPNMDVDMDVLLSKLEIHFSKSRNGGGEVEECELLPDSGTVVITFVSEDVAKGLTEKEHHHVMLTNKKKHRVRVTTFLKGQITHFKTKTTPCPRTVLLTGIPTIMEHETLQDLLEIHFQKTRNGGGEIESFLYNPVGQKTTALFGEALVKKQDEDE
ncbi:interferon-induced 35 kDa protein [Gouania willdenowi]|uniref:NID domain-containing protein n=1 Tax=Gouania willdenowi TaxID=441366 RepID=A0A8C5HTN5_GOUWI|nr:interferon-induced 35 kDa protein [Gouania willdenowi]